MLWWLTLSEAALKSICMIPASCPLSNAGCCVWDKPKSVSQVSRQIPIIKLCGWEHTTAFLKSSRTNRHQRAKHLRQYWCYGNRLVIGNSGGPWIFLNWDDIGLSPASKELPRRTRRRNTTLRLVARTSAVLFRKRGNTRNWPVQP